MMNLWNEYASCYNALAKEMNEKGIKIELLTNLISSHEKLLDSYQSFYQSQCSMTKTNFNLH